MEKPRTPNKPEHIHYVEILRTANQGDIALVKSILGPSGIVHYVADENFSTFYFGAQPARVMVDSERVDDAVALLEGLKFTRNWTSPESKER